MKRNNHLACLLLVSLLPVSTLAQVQTTDGVKLTTSGPLNLVFYDATWVNNGDVAPGTSTVKFCGSTSVSYIAGSRPIDFYNLIVVKPRYELSLQNSIRISGELIMEKGNLQLNEHAIDLGYTGYISRERNESRIQGGKNGIIKVSAILNAPNAANPGNIGVEISSPATLGETVIIRGYNTGSTEYGRLETHRYYEIKPQQNNNLHATLKFHYLDIELAGKKEHQSTLSLFTSRNRAGQWVSAGRDEIDIASNWIIKKGLSELHRFTIADAFINTKDQSQNSITNVQLSPNPTTGRFTVMVNIPHDRQVVFNLYDQLGRLLESRRFRCRSGLNILSWDIEKYVAGGYYLSMQNAGSRMLKIIKQ